MKYIRLFSYYGSKVRIARRYPRPQYKTIVEPFAGAAGYSCLHYRRNVVLFEINPTVYSAINYLITTSPEAVKHLPLLKDGERIDSLGLSEAEQNLIGFWAATAATNPGRVLYKWARDGQARGASGYWSAGCRSRLAVAVTKIKHWKVYNQSYETIDVNTIGPATWFVDPPYQQAGVHYKHGSKGIDYTHLAKWCRSLPGQVIVCENTGADWLPFRPLCKMVGAAKNSASRKETTEAIWTKDGGEYPSLFGAFK